MKTSAMLLMAKLRSRVSYRQIKNIHKQAVKKLIGLMSMLCVYVSAVGQSEGYKGPANIPGKIYIDTRLPNINLGKIINWKSNTARLSDFDGKIIIFDFWFTACDICLRQFPKEDSLQRLYADKIQIIPVTFEPEEKVAPFLAHWQDMHKIKLSLPFIVGDTVLNNCFQNIYYPHFVWLSQERIVTGITSKFFLTGENIEAIIRETEKQGYLSGERLNKEAHLDSSFIYHPVQE